MVSFKVGRPDWPHSFLTIPHQKLFNQLLIFVNLYQHIENQAVSLIHSEEMLDLKILQSQWLLAFWPIFQEQNFSQREDLYRNTVNNKNFHYKTNSEKINDQNFP